MIIEIRAKPGAKKEAIENISENNYLVSLKEKPESNRANRELTPSQHDCTSMLLAKA